LLAILTWSARAPAADEAKQTYHLPAGEATHTLKRFAQQSGREIIYPVEQVRGIQTKTVHGEFTALEAVTRMLEGTTLRATQDPQTGAVSVTRRPAPDEPRPPPSPPAAGQSRAGATANSDQVVHLPAFAVTSARDDSYVGREALSTTRTGVALLDLPQSVKVLNRTFIDDVNPTLVVDLLKYVGGGQAGNINFADDRFTMRGFNSPADIGDFVDGFRAKLDSNTDTAILERLEIIKGPSAIFVANGPVGGVINKVTKSPVSYEVRSLKVQAGLSDANRAELDLGGPVTADGRLLYRLVVAGQDSEGWYDHTYTQRLILAPSLSYVFSPESRVTLKYFYFDFNFSSYNGLPFDERTGRLIAIDRQSTFSEDDPLNWRKDIAHRFTLEYTRRLNDHLAMRVAGFHGYDHAGRVESVNGSSIPRNFVDGTLIPRNTTAQDREHYRSYLQGDLVGPVATGPVAHRLLVGGELADTPDNVAAFAGSSSAIDPFHPRFPGTVTVNTTTPASNLRTNNRQQKVFALETASFLRERLQFSLGGSRIAATTWSYNKLTGAATPRLRLSENLWQYGAVFKPVPGVSVFYGYNENFAPNFLNGLVLPSQLGRQEEFGLKAELLDSRLALNLAHFDIRQENVPVLSFPQTMPPTYVLVPGQSSQGVDGDIAWQITDHVSAVFTFAFLDAAARTQANSAAPVIVRPVNNVAETTYGLWTRYKFTDGALKGLTLGVGLSHLDKRAITSNNNATLYGWLDPYTVCDLMLSYVRGPIRYGLNVDNVFNTAYEAAVRNQAVIVPGMGTNVKASVTWRF
jgi:iron complex outermembrane receptor protein